MPSCRFNPTFITQILKFIPILKPHALIHPNFMSNLRVNWRKDSILDEAIENDKNYFLCRRVVKEVLNEPNQVISLRYLENRRERLRLNLKVATFMIRNPLLFEVYQDRIKPNSQMVRFLRISDRLRRFLEEERRIRAENEPILVAKLCKLLMMSRDSALDAEKLVDVKRDFGFPDDFLSNFVSKYPELFKLVGTWSGGRRLYVELVNWKPEFAKSVIELKAEEESRLTGIPMRPQFRVKLASGFFLKKEMREWTRDWMELPYVSPYKDVLHLDQASREMEKRTVGVFHELLSLTVLKRMAVPILGKFSEEFRFSNAFPNFFTRHCGIFYMSRKGGFNTAVLREAYQNGRLIDKDPLHEIKDRFEELLEEGRKERVEREKLRKEAVKMGMEEAALRARIGDEPSADVEFFLLLRK